MVGALLLQGRDNGGEPGPGEGVEFFTTAAGRGAVHNLFADGDGEGREGKSGKGNFWSSVQKLLKRTAIAYSITAGKLTYISYSHCSQRSAQRIFKLSMRCIRIP